jgi:hypothetical protein
VLRAAAHKEESMEQFPKAGDFFGVTHAAGKDGSYRSDVFECLASDEYRIVAKPIVPCFYKDGITFYRSDWIIQTVSDAVVATLQVVAEERAKEKTA